MADQSTIAYYKSWRHEKSRAISLGKMNYAANCQIEIDRLEAAHPELSTERCSCGVYPDCTG